MASTSVTETPRDLRFELSASVHAMSLRMEPVFGRRTFYATVTIGTRVFWVQRWDTGRCVPGSAFSYSADRLMCWTAGSRSKS